MNRRNSLQKNTVQRGALHIFRRPVEVQGPSMAIAALHLSHFYAFHLATSRTERNPKMGVVGGVKPTKKYDKPQIIENRGGGPNMWTKKRINPGPHKILQVGTNPNESEKKERIRTNPTLKFRVSLYFPHESNESEFYTVCAHKYYIRANGAKFGFVPSNINAGFPKKGGRCGAQKCGSDGFARIR